jgi:hypothetical protein
VSDARTHMSLETGFMSIDIMHTADNPGGHRLGVGLYGDEVEIGLPLNHLGLGTIRMTLAQWRATNKVVESCAEAAAQSNGLAASPVVGDFDVVEVNGDETSL